MMSVLHFQMGVVMGMLRVISAEDRLTKGIPTTAFALGAFVIFLLLLVVCFVRIRRVRFRNQMLTPNIDNEFLRWVNLIFE